MKRFMICLTVLLTSANTFAFTSEIKTISLNDGEVIEARLCLPESIVKTIVFCISGTGPTTYLTKRPTFNFFDELANGFCNEGVAVFTYNRRGCKTSDTPPLFVEVDSVKYAKYTPFQEAEDVEEMISFLRKDQRFAGCKILLYGLSEGTIIASLVADRKIANIDALLLHGYAHENMYDIIRWQDEGHGIMIMANSIFDKDGDKGISKEEYEAEEELIVKYKAYLFHNVPFDSLDIIKNGFIDINDIAKMRMPFHEELMKRVTNNDWFWIRSNYFNINPQWFKSHFELEANKTRLLRLNIPIHVFHGTKEANVPVESVYDLQERFEICNKRNLTIHVLENKQNCLFRFFRIFTRIQIKGIKRTIPNIPVNTQHQYHKNMKAAKLLLLSFAISLINCNMGDKQTKAALADDVAFTDNKTDSLREREHQKVWEEANKYKATITDSVFLKTKKHMSDQAINYLTLNGWNNDYAFNQVGYLAGLDRAKNIFP